MPGGESTAAKIGAEKGSRTSTTLEVGIVVEFREEDVWKMVRSLRKSGQVAGIKDRKTGLQREFAEKLKSDYKEKSMQSKCLHVRRMRTMCG